MKHTDIILTEMCSRVGCTLDDISDRKDPESSWFQRYTWTDTEETSFRTWLGDYLFTSAAARKEVMAHPYKSKKNCRKTADQFVYNFGWRVSNE